MKNECNNNRDYNNNITWHSHKVTRQERWKVNNSSGCAGGAILWFTGLSGSGKSSIANEVDYILNQKRKLSTYILDGDNIRHGLCKDLGFSLNDRKENIRRISEVAKLMFDAGMIVLAAFISPYRSDRDSIRHEIVPMYNNNDNDNDNDNDNNNKVSDFLRSKSSGAGGVVVHNPTAVTTGPASGTIAAAVAAATTTKPAATAITPLAQNDSGYITELRPYDVLFGRGSVSNDHEGNIRFRQLVAKRKGEYLSAKRRQRKAEIAREIVSSVLMDNGRFLKKVEDSSADVWVTADDETMMEKAKQALRQNKHKTSKVDEVVSGVGGSMSNSSPGNSTKKYCMTATDTSCRFVEIYVKASLETCESRDPKGLYEKARQGKIKNFTGIDDPYEEPINAEIVLNSDEKTVEELANEVVSWLERNGIIQYIR